MKVDIFFFGIEQHVDIFFYRKTEVPKTVRSVIQYN